MDIVIDPTGVPTLRGVDELTSLRLTGTVPSTPEARATLAGWGIEVLDDAGHGHIEPATFARLAGPAAERADWQAGLQGMLAYAVGKGWTDEAGRIRAHAEWDD